MTMINSISIVHYGWHNKSWRMDFKTCIICRSYKVLQNVSFETALHSTWFRTTNFKSRYHWYFAWFKTNTFCLLLCFYWSVSISIIVGVSKCHHIMSHGEGYSVMDWILLLAPQVVFIFRFIASVPLSTSIVWIR